MSRRERAAAAARGRRAESLVCAHLARAGYRIVGRNVRVGRREIDLIATRGRILAFVEVRSLRDDRRMSPLETISRAKIARIREAALRWVRDRGVRGCRLRFDAAAVTFETSEGRVDYREDAF